MTKITKLYKEIVSDHDLLIKVKTLFTEIDKTLREITESKTKENIICKLKEEFSNIDIPNSLNELFDKYNDKTSVMESYHFNNVFIIIMIGDYKDFDDFESSTALVKTIKTVNDNDNIYVPVIMINKHVKNRISLNMLLCHELCHVVMNILCNDIDDDLEEYKDNKGILTEFICDTISHKVMYGSSWYKEFSGKNSLINKKYQEFYKSLGDSVNEEKIL